MIKVALLVAFFLTLTLDELLNIGLLIVPGLSAKNAFLYVMLLAILCSKVIDRSKSGFQFPAIHLLFVLLIANASLSIFYMHFVSGDPPGRSLLGHGATLKSDLLDMYLMFLVAFYALDTREAAVRFAKLFLLVISVISLITLLDLLRLPDLGLTSYRGARLEGPLGAANAYGIFLAFFIPILFLAATGVGSRFLRLVYLLGAVVSTAFLIHTGSRGGFSGLVGGVFFAAWWLRGGYDFQVAIKRVAVISVVASLIVAVMLVTSEDVSTVVEQRVERTTEGTIDDASSGRLTIWGRALDYQLARPWTFITGVGWWTFWDKVGWGPHSVYINYFFSLGIIGLGLFVALLHQILTIGKRSVLVAGDYNEERLLMIGMVLGWSALVVAMITGSVFKPWMFIWPFTGCCLRIGYGLLLEGREQESVKPKVLVRPSSDYSRRLQT